MILAQAGGDVIWSWQFAWEILPELLEGLVVTVQATVLGSVVAVTLGLLLAVLRRSDSRAVSMPVGGFIEFIRSTPLLVQLYVLYFVLPQFGVTLGAMTAGVIGLGVHYATYTSEVYRAGIEGVPKGQWEAATALNLSTKRTWTGVVLPQAIPKVMPALGNYIVAMFKETPLLAAITVVEMFNQGDGIAGTTFRTVEAYTLVGVLFLVVSYPCVLLLRRLEARLALN